MSLFPDPRTATPEGLVAVGGHLSVPVLREAYDQGIFPWPQEGYPMLWFSPDPRGILDFSDLHLSHSFKKWLRKENSELVFTVNRAFDQVIRECQQQPRPGQDGTWILPSMVLAYQKMFAAGRALSGECWYQGELVGGIYGVRAEKYFSAESMFHRKSNASKYALLKMVEHLKAQGETWMDIQMVTEASSALGGKLISREEFLSRIGWKPSL